MQNNLALYILSNKNFFLPSLVTYRAVRDLISETKKFANCEEQPAQKNYCTFLSISWILVVAITTLCGPTKIIFSQLPKV